MGAVPPIIGGYVVAWTWFASLPLKSREYFFQEQALGSVLTGLVLYLALEWAVRRSEMRPATLNRP